MKIKITKALPARQIHLAILQPGSVIEIDDRAALRLIGRYAEAVQDERPVQPFEVDEQPRKPKGKAK